MVDSTGHVLGWIRCLGKKAERNSSRAPQEPGEVNRRTPKIGLPSSNSTREGRVWQGLRWRHTRRRKGRTRQRRGNGGRKVKTRSVCTEGRGARCYWCMVVQSGVR